MTDTKPILSVIITSMTPLHEIIPGLAPIIKQCQDQGMEIILACCSDSDRINTVTTHYPNVILLQLPSEAHLPRLLGVALARATGQVIAITDVTCEIDENWISEILKAHQKSPPVIGGAVEPKGLRSLVAWAAYFCDYGQFMLPFAEGAVGEIPGNNISIKRWALERGKEVMKREFWKTHWCLTLQEKGINLYAVPSIIVSYRKSFHFCQYLERRFHHGRCFGGMRAEKMSQGMRMVYSVFSPLLPILFCVRILRAVLPKRRYLCRLFLSFPIIIQATISWSLGELVGYLSGTGTSCRHVR